MTAQRPGQAAITRVRKRPVEVEAIRWTGDNVDEVYELTGCDSFDVLDEQDRLNCDDPEATASVFDKLHSMWVLVYTGQWVIRGVRGEFYPCADDVFRETYEDAAQERPAPASASQARRREEQAAPELAAAMREARGYREGIAGLLDELKTSAAATHPSKKSQIESAVVRKLQKILDGR